MFDDDEQFVILLLSEGDNRARLYATRDIEKSLRNMNDRGKVVLPVFALCCDPERFLAVTGTEKLPGFLSIDSASELFGHTRTDRVAQTAMRQQLRRLGPARSMPLLRRWHEAVLAAEERAA